ncbi:MAG: GTP 3',8-cyclase MoaA [Oligoflexus sp.]
MLVDPYTRRIRYIRLSITDVCNFRCVYCLPNGYQKPCHGKQQLQRHEIRRLMTTFATMGVKKIRITGGEPTIRPDFLDITRDLAAIDGVEVLALTTNGFKLSKRVQDYYAAGIRQLNVSIDSLRSEHFKNMTGRNHLGEILKGLELAQALPFQSIKINALLTKRVLNEEMADFCAWIKDRDMTLRFIEIMPTASNLAFRKENFVSGDALRRYLKQHGWEAESRSILGGPAQVFFHPESKGKIGLIAPYDEGFCATCNRVRVNSYGELRLCLWEEKETDLKPWLQADDQQRDLQEKLIAMLRLKPEKHQLHDNRFAANSSFSLIGG